MAKVAIVKGVMMFFSDNHPKLPDTAVDVDGMEQLYEDFVTKKDKKDEKFYTPVSD